MDLFKEEEIFGETRAKLVDYNDTVAGCGRGLNVEKIKRKLRQVLYVQGSRSQLSSPDSERGSEPGRLWLVTQAIGKCDT